MISVKAADKILSAHLRSWGEELIPIDQTISRILDEDVVADRDMPPFDRVTMDGITIRYQDFKEGCRVFKIEGIAAAGQPIHTLHTKNACLEIMTGAILPIGADTVIRYEDILIKNGHATIRLKDIKAQQNVHKRGSDRIAGNLIIKSPKQISPAEINVAATVGRSNLYVLKNPNTIIISTGDELVEINEHPLPHQIRRSNIHMVDGALQNLKIEADLLHIRDDQEELHEVLSQVIDDYDLVILSGGVSAGKYDLVPNTLENIGVNCHFHKVTQRPGKPLWFGTKGDEVVVFGLPGNPSSTFLCMNRYVIPWIKKCQGLYEEPQTAILTEDISFEKSLTYFAQVSATIKDGQRLVTPVLGRGSGDLANLVDADGYIEIPAEFSVMKKGAICDFYSYR